jgi:maltose O-acetyltransferase
VIGNRGGFGTGCFVSAQEGGIEIGDNFICGPNVNILGGNYEYHTKNVHLEDLGSTSKGIMIGNNVWVGAGTTILDGTVIGDNTIIVANSLVNRRFPPNVVIQGNPAKVIMHRR